MRPIILLALLALIASPLLAAEMVPVPVATAGLTDTPPALDGALDDACWQSATILGSFVKLDASQLASPGTEARICWDASNLYVGVRCEEPNMKALKMQMTARDDAVWRDDCVELFLDTNLDRTSYYHFAINALGTVMDEARPGTIEWDANVRAAGARGDDAWTIEVAIPLADLGGAQPGDRWGLNIGRERQAGGSTELSAWSPTYGQFLVPERFGELLLSDRPGGFDWQPQTPALFGPWRIDMQSTSDAQPTLRLISEWPEGMTREWQAPEPRVARAAAARGMPHRWLGEVRVVDGSEQALVIEQSAGDEVLFRQAVPIIISPRPNLPLLAREASALQGRAGTLPALGEEYAQLVADAGGVVERFVQSNLQREEPMTQQEWATEASSQSALLTRISGMSCVVWTQSPMEDLDRRATPPSLQPDPTLRIVACGNEIESAALNITNLAEGLFEGRVTIGDLRLSSGEALDGDAENLVTNADFAADEDADGVPDAWSVSSRRGSIGIEEQADGSKALVLSGEGDTMVVLRQRVPLEPGKTYTLVAEMSAEDLPGASGYAHVINNGWTWSTGVSPLTPRSAADRYAVSFRAPDSALFQVVLRLESGAGGTIRYHSIRVVEGGAEQTVFSPDCITFHEGEFRDLKVGRTVCDPLPLMNEARIIRVPAGESRQVFLNVDSAKLPPGDYSATIQLRPHDREQPLKAIPLRLTVLPVRLPERMPIATFNWDYARTEPYVEDLVAHYTTSFLLNTSPRMTFDAEGNVTAEADWSSYDPLLQVKLRHARENGGIIVFSYGIVRDFDTQMRARHGWQFMSEPWQKAFRAWVAEFERHMREDIGMAYEEYAVQIWDEATHTNAELSLRGGQLIREVVPQMRLCMDGAQNPDEVRMLDPVVDLWIPHQSALYTRERAEELREVYREIAEAGEPVWTYTCSTNMKALSPLDYYRLKEWRVWDLGVGGSCYWAYNSWRGDPWDDFDGEIADCGSIYDGPQGPITSRRWESTRDGREDYKALYLLREISRIQGAEAADRVEALTDALVAEVLAAPESIVVFERARARLLEVLVAHCGEGAPSLESAPEFAWTGEGLRVGWEANAMTEGLLRYRVPGDADWREARFADAGEHEALLSDLPPMRDVEWYLLWWDHRGATGAELAGLRSEGWAETR